jgi:hydrogenase maturation protease
VNTRSLLVLGLGNAICTDDGVGVAVIEQLRDHYDFPDDVRVLDGGTLGLALLPYLQEADAAILVDAVAADAPPGSLVRLEGDAVTRAAAHHLSVHQIGVADLLDGARLLGDAPEQMVLVGVVPASVELGVERTPAVEAAIPRLVAQVVDEAAALGHRFTRRDRGEGQTIEGRLERRPS